MSDMNVIINEKHFERVCELLKSGEVVLGGEIDSKRRFIAPALLDHVAFDSPIMQEEIFGPILPMISYTELSECIRYIIGKPKPLALYLFTKDKEVEKQVLNRCTFGNGCMNDTIIHLANSHLGFGGVGESGMGNYHGKKSFDTFPHERSIVKQGTWIDIPIRYRPYTSGKSRILRMFLK